MVLRPIFVRHLEKIRATIACTRKPRDHEHQHHWHLTRLDSTRQKSRFCYRNNDMRLASALTTIQSNYYCIYLMDLDCHPLSHRDTSCVSVFVCLLFSRASPALWQFLPSLLLFKHNCLVAITAAAIIIVIIIITVLLMLLPEQTIQMPYRCHIDGYVASAGIYKLGRAHSLSAAKSF